MPAPDRDGYFLGMSQQGFHRVAYVEWGDPAARRVVICAHGLSRQGRDFDVLACALAEQGWRVVCPDLVGRGRSDWLRDADEYNLPQYAMDLTALIAWLGVPSVDWIGTSLGGLIGMVIAGQPGSPIKRLVINDIGPFLPWRPLHRISGAVRDSPHSFADFDTALRHYRAALAPFGQLSDHEWRHLTFHSLRRSDDGVWHARHDPGIIAAFRSGWIFNITLWHYWDVIRCPTLVLRGAESDLLLPETAREMTRRGPGTTVVEIIGCGHAPALLDEAQVDAVSDWLHGTQQFVSDAD